MLSKLFRSQKPLQPETAKQLAKTAVKKPADSGEHGASRRSHRKSNKKPPKPKWQLSDFQVPVQEGKTRFHDLGLSEPIMHALHDLGFEYCTPIQAQVLPHSLKESDAIGKAQTGTGKTAAFLITLIEDLLKYPLKTKPFLAEPRALVVAPTRELVAQIASDAQALCKYTDLHLVTLVGGMDYHKQKQAVEQRPLDIVVATPGRLIDFMTRRDIYLDRIEALVLDEADRMLDMGFIPQVKRIVRATPRNEDRQTLLFSATFTQDILNLARQWTFDAVNVEIEPEQVATETVDQKTYTVSRQDKLKLLCNILRQPEVERTIVFANRRDQTQRLFDKVKKAGFQVGILSGEIQQKRRTRTLEDFKKGNIKVLVATDVVGRGIHVEGVTHVVNYNLPEDPEDYVHRIGRTGRAGASGVAINLACEEDAFQIPEIESLLGERLICELPPPHLLEA